MSKSKTIELKRGEVLTIAYVDTDDRQPETVATPAATPRKGGKQGPRKQRADETEAAYAARVARYNAKNGKSQAAAPSDKKSDARFKPLCEAKGLMEYTGPNGVKTHAIWAHGQDGDKTWYILKPISKNGFACFFGGGKSWQPKQEKIVKISFEEVDRVLLCGCPKCKAMKAAA